MDKLSIHQVTKAKVTTGKKEQEGDGEKQKEKD